MNYLADYRGNILAKKVEKTNYLSSTRVSRTARTEEEQKHIKKCKLQICDECKRIAKK